METETLRPNGAGDETAIKAQYPDSTYHWDKVDEEVADDADTRVMGLYGTGRDLYALPSHSVGSGTISKITVFFRCLSQFGSGKAAASIKAGSTVADGSWKTVASSYTTYSSEWSTNPDTGNPWTWDDIDALQAGVHLDYTSEGAACTQVYVEVEYGVSSYSQHIMLWG